MDKGRSRCTFDEYTHGDIIMIHHHFMNEAFTEAFSGMRANEGGPFGAIVVANTTIIGRGHNMVTKHHDPTAHAEIVAIRNACAEVQSFHLDDAVIYTTCEPCPMCLAAIYWARIKTVYYYYTKADAAEIGFSDKFIYEEIAKAKGEHSIKIEKIDLTLQQDLFGEWRKKEDRTQY